jgi:hypothetical protein
MENQAQRRVKYGLNFAVVTVVAVALCVLINFISYRTLREGWARFDTSHLGRYSLSPQTRAVLGGLTGDYRIVTIFSETSGLSPEDVQSQSEQITQAAALAELYGQYNRHIVVEQLRPAYDLGRMDKFYDELRARYQDQTRPVAGAVAAARQVLTDLHRDSAALSEKLTKVAQDPALPDGTLRNYLIGALQLSAGLGQRTGDDDKQVRAQLASPLPDYGGARDLLTREFEALAASKAKAFDAVVTAIRAQALPAVAEAPKQLQPAATEALQAVIKLFEAAPKQMGPALAALHAAPGLDEYSRLQSQIEEGNAVLVMGPKSVRVLRLSQFFPAPGRSGSGDGASSDRPRSVFLGEERLTGALVSLGETHPPLVVFVATGNQPALGSEGLYNAVAERLRSMGFNVQAWSPYQHSPEGETQEVPAPQPAPGEKAVWVLLPNETPSPYGSPGPNEQRAVEHIRQRMAAGDAVLVILGLVPANPFGPSSNPVTTMLAPMGIAAHADQVVLQALTRSSSNRPDYSAQFLVDNWPRGQVIAQSMTGLSGLFVASCPLTLSSGADGKAQSWPLAEVHGTNLFTQQLSMTQQEIQRDPATARDSYIVAAAAQRGATRVVVIADAAAATDRITTIPVAGASMQETAGKAELYGAAFPANAELFVNSVYWLAGDERLIAASPRSQDIRRIRGDLTATGRLGLAFTLMGCVILLTAGAGLTVWLTRRA